MEFNYTQFYDPGIMASRFEMGGGSGDESPSSSQQCFQSEPLSRGASSHGSSQGSSTMTSPVFDSVQYASYALSQLSASPETESRLLLPTSPGASGSYSPDLERDMASPTRHPDDRHNRQNLSLTVCPVLIPGVTIPSAASIPAVWQDPLNGAQTSIGITSTVTPRTLSKSPSSVTMPDVHAAWILSTGWITFGITYESTTRRTLRSEAAAARTTAG
ncbi:hypothetical protein OCS_05564 [Ophiocordyceps sinensis CO18]|uniref:Uncharacterized protein n=1 Tax=Ophiocordyceps sinensis (strain Co18 / CGMCC 3.14243) TaxID=911162 RepID=T5A011_OPHSC|nr:hypothetical protein OCS_05564 [Ophiocordyceps sinensis CO18]